MTVRHMGFDLERKHSIIVRLLRNSSPADAQAVLECLKPINLRRAVAESLGLDD